MSRRQPARWNGSNRGVLLSTFSNADLTGSLTLASMQSTGTVISDGNGNFIGGSETHDNGTTDVPIGTYALAADGSFTIPDTSPKTGAMSSSKDVVAFNGQSNNSLGILISSGSASFSDADLTGTWYLFDNGDSGPPDNYPTNDANNTGHATVVFDGKGGLTYIHSNDESGSSETGGGTYTVSPTGAVNVVVTSSSSGGSNLPNFTGAMNSSKDVVAMDATDLPTAASTDNSHLIVMVQPSGIYSNTDLQGAWALSTDNGQGTIIFDGAGNITGTDTSFGNSSGTQTGTVTGTYSVSADGSFTVTPTTTFPDHTDTGAIINGWINASRNLIFAGQPASGQKGLDDLSVLINSNTPLGAAVSLKSSSSSTSPGQSVTLTATVTTVRLSNNTPTGSVNFFDGGTLLGSAPLLAVGTASFSTSSLATGTHSITASYSGDTTFAAAASASTSVQVFIAQTIGGLDQTFGSQGRASHDIGFTTTRGVAADGTQSVIIGTDGSSPNGSFGLARYNADGSLDTGFGGGVIDTSFAGTDDVPTAVNVLPGGQILVAGTATTYINGVAGGSQFAIAEFNPDGSLDTSFGGGTGQMLVSFSNTAGTLSNDVLQAMAIGAGGVIYLGGSSDAGGTSGTDFAIAALNADGSVDGGFGSGGKILQDFAGGGDILNSLALQTNGDIVVAGSATIGGVSEIALARFLPAGILDSHFGIKGLVTTSVGGVYDSASSVVIQPNNEIVIGGLSATGSGSSLSSDFVVARYTSAGRIDRSFGGGPVITSFGQPSAITQLVLQPNGNIVASGKTTASLAGLVPSELDVAIARYTTHGLLDTTFNGTGKTIIGLSAGAVGTTNSQIAIEPLDASSLSSTFNQFINSQQGVVAVTPGGAILDAGSNGSNTVVAKLITAGVDLVATLLTLPPAAVIGGAKGTASVQITEGGTDQATGAVTIELVVASDAQGDGATTLKTTAERINLRQQQHHAYRISFVYPVGLTAGSYYLEVVVNDGSAASFADLNAGNNLALSSRTVAIAPKQISLIGSNLSAASTFVAGKIAKVVFTLANQGNVLAKGSTTAQFFLSTNQTPGGGTITASNHFSVGLAPSRNRTFRLNFILPSTFSSGTYYLVAVIDPVNSLGTIDRSDSMVVDATQVVVG